MPPQATRTQTSRQLASRTPQLHCWPCALGSFFSSCVKLSIHLLKFIVCGSPSSSTITDAMSSYLKPSLWHCVSHMNLGSCHPAVLVTTLGMKLSSTLFSSLSTSMSLSWYDSHSCVSEDSFRTTAFLFSKKLQQNSRNLGSLQKLSSPHRP